MLVLKNCYGANFPGILHKWAVNKEPHVIPPIVNIVLLAVQSSEESFTEFNGYRIAVLGKPGK